MRSSWIRPRHVAAALAAAVALTACSGAADDDGLAADTTAPVDEGTVATTDDATHDPSTDATDAGSEVATDDGGSAGSPAADAAADPVLGLVATAPDGSTFSIADFTGSPVLVETFATWCSSCRAQLGDTQAAAAEAGDGAVFLALSVESDLDPATLEEYAAANGFDDVRFGVLDRDGLVALQERYGGAVLTPPSTPKFRVDPDGGLSDLTTGFETRTEILASLGL